MATPKRYIHDRLVLLLLTVNTFFVTLISILIAFSLSNGSKKVFIIEHRQHISQAEISANTVGTRLQETSFIVFLVMVLIFHIVLSKRVYHVRRNFAVVILSMGTLLILLTGVITYYLLQQ